MQSILITLAKFLAVPIVSVLTFAGYNVQPQKVVVPTPAPQTKTITLGNYNPSGGGTYRLKNSIGLSAISVNLSSFKEPTSNIPYTMAYLNSTTGYGTLDPQTPTKSEFVSFTGITQNSDGSATLTGVVRGLSRTPGTGGCVASTTLAVSHSGQSIFILSNSPCFYSEYAVKGNDETISGSWTVPAPTTGGNPTTKTYVDALVNGGTVSYDKIAVAGTAGETISAGQVLYLRQGDGRWYKAGISTTEASTTVLGIAQGSGVSAGVIGGGILLSGLDTNQSGLTVGLNYFLGPTAGTISNATSTRSIGRARTSTSLYFDTYSVPLMYLTNKFFKSNEFASSTTFSGTAGFLSTTTFSSTASSSISFTATSSLSIGSFPAYRIGKNIKSFTTPGNNIFTVPWGIQYVQTECVGAGAGGGASNSSNSGGGGGGSGAYARHVIDVTGTSSIVVFIGIGGLRGQTSSTGMVGSSTVVSSYYSIAGGLGGVGSTGTSVAGGVGGAATAGLDFSSAGGSGTISYLVGTSGFAGQGGSSYFGSGGFGGGSAAGAAGQGGIAFGSGAGGGANNSGGDGAGGACIFSW